METQPIRVSLKGVAHLYREGRMWIASCPALRITTQGRTRSEARRMFDDALRVNIEVYQERGVLGEVIREALLDPNVWLEPASSEPHEFELSVSPALLAANVKKTIRATAQAR